MSLLGAAAILGGTSLIGGLLNTSSQQSVNQQNYKMFKESQDYDYKKFQEEKAYNSLRHQVNMMRAAGLNPALNTGMSSSVSAGGSPSPIPMEPVDYGSVVANMGSAVSTLFDADLKSKQGENVDSNTNLNNIDMLTRGLKNLEELRKIHADYKKAGMETRSIERQILMQDLNNQFLQQTLGDRVMQQQWSTELTRASAEAQLLSNKFIEPTSQAAVNQMIAQTYANYATGKASLQQAHSQLMQVYALYGKSDKERSQFFKATLDGLIQARRTAASQEYKNVRFPWSYQIGSSMFGSMSHSTVQSYQKDFDNWYKKRYN